MGSGMCIRDMRVCVCVCRVCGFLWGARDEKMRVCVCVCVQGVQDLVGRAVRRPDCVCVCVLSLIHI